MSLDIKMQTGKMKIILDLWGPENHTYYLSNYLWTEAYSSINQADTKAAQVYSQG